MIRIHPRGLPGSWPRTAVVLFDLRVTADTLRIIAKGQAL